MNLFYAPPARISGRRIRLDESEARHAARVLRYREGDAIRLTDGQGTLYEGRISRVGRNEVDVEWTEREKIPSPRPHRVLGMGIIKKRDRLEFAVEKAVELGASGIALFRSRHGEKENVRMDRLESAALSAMKQSLRTWLPSIQLYDSPEEVMEEHGEAGGVILAHGEGDQPFEPTGYEGADKLLLMVGPEGGFSDEEVRRAREKGAGVVSLGSCRLRTETAALVMLSGLLRADEG